MVLSHPHTEHMSLERIKSEGQIPEVSIQARYILSDCRELPIKLYPLLLKATLKFCPLPIQRKIKLTVELSL